MTTAISRVVFNSYSAKPGITCTCRAQILPRSSPSARRALTGEGLGSGLDCGVGISHQVVEPVRICRCAAFRRKHSPRAVAEILTGERVDSLDPGLSSAVMQKQKGVSFELTTNPAAVASELLDDPVVPVVSHVYLNVPIGRAIPATPRFPY